MIELKNVTMKFRMANDRISSLKEYLVKKVTGQIKYKEFTALSNVSFSIKKGEVVGIVGGNGAGKSTLLKIISGILTPTEGTALCTGNIAPLLELGAGFDMDLTARENIFLNGAVLGYSKPFLVEKYNQIVDFAELHEFMEVPVRNFSSGMVARLAFSIATLVNPDVLIVDEILSVGDAHFQQKSANRMRALINGGATVILVSHSISQIREICSKVVWLNRGKVMMVGPTEEVCDAYMSSLSLEDDEKESEVPPSINYEDYLYSPTAISKFGEYYFIVDCWHHRVIYSKDLNKPLVKWNAVTGKFVNPHSISSDGLILMVEDTKNDKVKVLTQNGDSFDEVQVLSDLGNQPNKIVYDEKRKLFYGIAASSQQIFVLKSSNGHVELQKLVKIDQLGTSYVRSLSLIDDSLYLVSGPGKIIELNIVDLSFQVIKTYKVPKDLLGMNEIVKLGSYFYISSYQNADGDIAPKFVRVKKLEDLGERAEDLYAKLNLKGVPYGMSIIDERFFLTEIDSYSRILSFLVVNDEIEDVKIHFDSGAAHSGSLFRRKALTHK